MERRSNDKVVLNAEGLSRRKFIGGVALAGGMVSAAGLTGCGSSSAKVYTATEQNQLITQAVNTFAATYPTSPVKVVSVGTTTQVTSGTVAGLVANASNPDLAYIATGDPGTPTTLTAILLSKSPGITPADLAEYAAFIQSILTVGTNVTITSWTVNGVSFTSMTISDGTGVIYDSFLSNLVTEEATARTKTCLSLNVKDGLGKIVVTFIVISQANCRNGVLQFPLNYAASHTVKKPFYAKLNVKAEKLPNTQCQKVTYSYAYSSPTNRITTLQDGFTLSVNFGTGAANARTGSCTECCVTGAGGGTQ